MAKKHWIQKAIKHPGSFGKATPEHIAAGKRSKNPTTVHRAVLAETLAHLARTRHHKK